MELEIKPPPFTTESDDKKLGWKWNQLQRNCRDAAALTTSLPLLMLMTMPSFLNLLCPLLHISLLSSWPFEAPFSVPFYGFADPPRMFMLLSICLWHSFLASSLLELLTFPDSPQYCFPSKFFPDHPGWNDLLLPLFFIKNTFSFSNR